MNSAVYRIETGFNSQRGLNKSYNVIPLNTSEPNKFQSEPITWPAQFVGPCTQNFM